MSRPTPTKQPIISLIAAIGQNHELGRDNKLLWHIPEDMKRFKHLTTGHVVIMGRKTYESIGRTLPNRVNIIITKDQTYQAPNCLIAHSLDEAIEFAKNKEKEEIFIIGGGQIYTEAMKYANKLYLTVIEMNFDADTFFPDFNIFNKVIEKRHSSYKNYRYEFLTLER